MRFNIILKFLLNESTNILEILYLTSKINRINVCFSIISKMINVEIIKYTKLMFFVLWCMVTHDIDIWLSLILKNPFE